MSLAAYYQMTFALVQHHNYSLSEIDRWMPWEREIYMGMLEEFLKEQEDARRAQQMRQ